MARESGRKKLETALAAAAVGKHGGDVKSEKASIKRDNVTLDRATRGNSREYLIRRLKKDHPKVFQDWLDGHHKSPRQAAIAAGIIKAPVDKGHNPLVRMKWYWSRAPKEEREAFRKWLRTKEAK